MNNDPSPLSPLEYHRLSTDVGRDLTRGFGHLEMEIRRNVSYIPKGFHLKVRSSRLDSSPRDGSFGESVIRWENIFS